MKFKFKSKEERMEEKLQNCPKIYYVVLNTTNSIWTVKEYRWTGKWDKTTYRPSPIVWNFNNDLNKYEKLNIADTLYSWERYLIWSFNPKTAQRICELAADELKTQEQAEHIIRLPEVGTQFKFFNSDNKKFYTGEVVKLRQIEDKTWKVKYEYKEVEAEDEIKPKSKEITLDEFYKLDSLVFISAKPDKYTITMRVYPPKPGDVI